MLGNLRGDCSTSGFDQSDSSGGNQSAGGLAGVVVNGLDVL